MEYPKEYTNIYVRFIDEKYMNLVFYNNETKNSILFDGSKFCFMINSILVPSGFVELDYSRNNIFKIISIDSIRSKDDVFYIKFSNQDIFKIYNLMSDEEDPQRLEVYKPHAPFYKLTLSGFNSKLELDLQEEKEYKYINEWFER
jgi:hypothetical protein